MTYDVRAVANFVLDCGDQLGASLTNIDVNKVVYFLHGWYLAKYGRPLVSAKIEAWPYGPVFRELYSEFRVCGPEPITIRAARINPANCQKEICAWQFSDEERAFLSQLASRYVKMSTSTLLALSHVKGGPWDRVYNHERRVNPGMEISNDLIKTFFEAETRH
jgi:uncharacterized phage-associated protein